MGSVGSNGNCRWANEIIIIIIEIIHTSGVFSPRGETSKAFRRRRVSLAKIR